MRAFALKSDRPDIHASKSDDRTNVSMPELYPIGYGKPKVIRKPVSSRLARQGQADSTKCVSDGSPPNPAGLPVAGVETARKVVDKSQPSNLMMGRWTSSEGKPI